MKFYQKWLAGIYSTNKDREWFPATVPGNVQYDYGEVHGFGDPDYMNHHQQYLELEDVTWEYKTKLSYEQNNGETVWFVSLGVDYRYDVLLNDEIIYSYEGMYQKVEIDLTEKLKGQDELSVIVYPHPKLEGAPVGTRQEAAASCKPPMCYGWDWQPRLLISGMWQEAYVETRGRGFIADCEPFTFLNDDFSEGTIKFDIVCDETCQITVLDINGRQVYSGTDTTITIQNPDLWWCNGQGAPNLYSWKVTSDTDEKSGTLAFKKLRLVRNEGVREPLGFPKSRYAAPITVELNGRRIFIKGSNWVNPKLFLGTAEKSDYEEYLQLVKDANMNLLRIWGGSGVNKDSFYDICDKMGILVWQEFPLSCNEYPDTEQYLKVLESEAIAIIKSLRRHACLAFWCGGNELFNSWSGMDDQSLSLRLLDSLCYKHDFGRPFLKTSPLMGMAHGGYTFLHPELEIDVVHAIRHSTRTAYTEFGLSAMTDVETLKKIIPEQELFPILETQAWVERHGLKAWNSETWICQSILEHFFGKADSIEQLVEQSQELQAIGYQLVFEAMRQQWPYCSMALNWCLNEPWSNAANNCILSYPARPRKSYYSVQQALRPTIFSAGVDHYDWKEGELFSADIWLLNDSPDQAVGKVTVELVMSENVVKLIEWEAQVDPNMNIQGPTVHVSLPRSESDFFTLRLKAENGMGSEYKLHLRHLPRQREIIKVLNQ